MKKSVFMVMLLLLGIAIPAFAQLKVTLNMSSRPDPYLSNWAERKETVIVTVINSGTSSIRAKFDCKINKDGLLIVNTKPEKMKILDIPSGVSQYYGEDLVPFEAAKIKDGADQTAIKTGMLPAGSYEFCCALFDPQDKQLTAPVCKSFTLLSYQAPVLLQPEDKGSVKNKSRPMFRWTAVSPKPNFSVSYQLRVFEVLAGQTPINAFRANRPILERSDIPVTQLQWPADVELPNPKLQHIWTVRALDDKGNAIGEPMGYATPFTFTDCCYRRDWADPCCPPDDKVVDKGNLSGKDVGSSGTGSGGSKNSDNVITEKSSEMTKISEERDKLIRLLRPINGSVVKNNEPLTFSWKTIEGNVSVKFKIVEVDSNQTPVSALNSNRPIFEQSNIKNNTLEFNKKLKEGKLYAWTILTQESNTLSEIRTFSTNGYGVAGKVASTVDEFRMSNYIITVTNEDPSATLPNFTGTGTITLWNGGPTFTLAFSSLVLVQHQNGTYACAQGDITKVINEVFTLPNAQYGEGKFYANKFHIWQDGEDWDVHDTELEGYIEWDLPPHLVIGQNSIQKIKTITGKLQVRPIGKIMGHLKLLQDYTFSLLDDLSGFKLFLDKNNSWLHVGGGLAPYNNLTLKFDGNVELPPTIQDVSGNPIVVNFTDANNLSFFSVNTTLQNADGIRLIPNTNITYKPVGAIIDFSDAQSPNSNYMGPLGDVFFAPQWKGAKFLSIKVLVPTQVTASSGDLSIQTPSETVFSHFDNAMLGCFVSNGSHDGYRLHLQTRTPFGNSKYKTFSGTLGGSFWDGVSQPVENPAGIQLSYENGMYFNSFLRCKVKIPFTNSTLGVEMPISQNGLEPGYVLPSSLGDKIVYSTMVNSKLRELKLVLNSAVFVGDELKMNASLNYTFGKFNGNTNIPELYVRSDGMVNPGNIISPNWYTLPIPMTAKLSNFSTMVSKIKISYLPEEHKYKLCFAGGIVLADNLASNWDPTSNSGTLYVNPNFNGGFNVEVENWINAPYGGNLSYNKFKVNGIGVNFENDGFKFSGSVAFFEDDQIYGDGFKGDLSLLLKKKVEISAAATLYIGNKSPEDFKYWFVEAGVSFGEGVNLMPLTGVPMTIHGFTGRAYYKMKHNGSPWNVTSTDFVPDNLMKFGLMAKMPISLSDAPQKFWGNTAFEMSFSSTGSISQMTFFGDAYCISSGFNQTDAKMKLNGSIGYYAPPVTQNAHFLATLNGNVGIPNVSNPEKLCADGGVALYIQDSDDWYINIGSNDANKAPGNKISSKLFCKDNYLGSVYFMMGKHDVKAGISQSYNSDEQEKPIFNWLKGYYSYGFGANNDMSINYSPFQVTSSMGVVGNGDFGFYYRWKKLNGSWKDWQKKPVLSANIGSNLEFQFPDPLCIAGKVFVSTTIPVINQTYGFEAKFRWKNGVFSQNSTCVP